MGWLCFCGLGCGAGWASAAQKHVCMSAAAARLPAARLHHTSLLEDEGVKPWAVSSAECSLIHLRLLNNQNEVEQKAVTAQEHFCSVSRNQRQLSLTCMTAQRTHRRPEHKPRPKRLKLASISASSPLCSPV